MTFVQKTVRGVEKYFIDGQEVTQEAFEAAFEAGRPKIAPRPVRARSGKRGYPIKCVAMAVHSSQVAEAEAHARERGVPTEFTKGGRPILRDAAHRKAYMKTRGFFDRNCYN